MKRFVTALVALAVIGAGIATAALLTSSQIEQLEKSGPQWADVTTYGGYGCADRMQNLETDGSFTLAGLTSFTGAIVKDTDQLIIDDNGTTKKATYQVIMDGVEDLASFTGAIVPGTDTLCISDAGVAKKTTFQVLMDGVQDLVAFTGAVVPATDALLIEDAGVAKLTTYQVLMDGIEDLVATDVTFVPATDKLLVSDGGVAVNVTYQVLMNGVNDLGAGAVATTDTFLMIDAGDGVAKKETVDDLATLFAGTGLTATNAVIAVDTSQALETISGTNLVLNSTNPMTLQIGTVDILQLDETAIATFAAAADTAGHDFFVETEDGGAATTGNTGVAGGAFSLKTGDGSTGATGENFDGDAGGAIGITSGAGGAAGLLVAGTADGKAGGAIGITAGAGGEGGAGAGGEGGTGGGITLTGGTGGGGSSTTKGAGGDLTVTAGSAGGAGATGGTLALDAGAANGGTAGALTVGGTNAETVAIGRATKVVTILGNAAAINGIVGNDTDLDITAKAGATDGYPLTLAGGAGTGAGNDGGLISITSGAGVAATGATGGPSGAITIASGAPGGETTGTAGLSGTVTINTGTGATATGAAGIGGASGPINIQVGTGGTATDAGSGDGGAGGALTLYAGTGGASTFANQGDGGSVTIRAGAGNTNGSISIGATNAAAVGIGRLTIATTVTGAAIIDQENATTNSVLDALTLKREVTAAGVGADGLGVGIPIHLESSDAGEEEMARINFELKGGITQAAADVDMAISLNVAGAITEMLRLDADDGTASRLILGADAHSCAIELHPPTTNTGTLVILPADSAGDTVTTITNASQGGTRTYTIPDSGASASEFLLTDRTKTKWTFMISGANGEDTDGVLTNAGGIAGGSKPTGVTSTEAAAAYCKVYDAGTTSYQNLATSQTGTDVSANYQIFSDTKGDGDAIYFGGSIPFCEIGIDMGGVVQNYTGNAITWYYYNGSDWTTTLTVRDATDATAGDGLQAFQRDGAVSFVPPGNWGSVAVDGQTAYWIKAEITTVANIGANQSVTNAVEHYVISPDGDAVQIPYKCNISEVRVTNLGATVHDQIVKFVLFNFTKGTYSLELSWAASQNTDTFTTTALKAASAGVDCDAGDVLGILVTEDNGATNNPTNIMVELDVTLTD